MFWVSHITSSYHHQIVNVFLLKPDRSKFYRWYLRLLSSDEVVRFFIHHIPNHAYQPSQLQKHLQFRWRYNTLHTYMSLACFESYSLKNFTSCLDDYKFNFKQQKMLVKNMETHHLECRHAYHHLHHHLPRSFICFVRYNHKCEQDGKNEWMTWYQFWLWACNHQIEYVPL